MRHLTLLQGQGNEGGLVAKLHCRTGAPLQVGDPSAAHPARLSAKKEGKLRSERAQAPEGAYCSKRSTEVWSRLCHGVWLVGKHFVMYGGGGYEAGASQFGGGGFVAR